MAISQLPPAPARTDDPSTFISKTDAFLPALTTFVNETNALASNLNSVAAGGAYAIPYVVDLTSNANSDPGSGKLRFGNTTQASSTSLYVDTLSYVGGDVTGLLDGFSASSSAVKGKLRLTKVGDTTKYITFDVTSITTSTGYRGIQITNAWGSSTSPFLTGDIVLMFFERTGDIGLTGPAGTLTRRATAATVGSTIALNAGTTDILTVTGLNVATTFSAPTGTVVDGQGLLIRIKDDGTSRALAWNAIYRQGSDLLRPTQTVAGKFMYVGYVYNASSSTWDLVSLINNF